MNIQETNDFDILRGKEINDMERLFQKRLDEIEFCYRDYFTKRPSKKASEEYDRLHNHYFYHQYGNQAGLVWLDKSDLPQNIKTEVENVFKGIFI